MKEKKEALVQGQEEKVSGGKLVDSFDIYNPEPILKVFCHNRGSTDLTKNMKFDSHNRKIFVYHCNNCGNQWETLPMPIKPDQK